MKKIIIGTLLVLMVFFVGCKSEPKEIGEYQAEIGEYQAMESFWEDYIDLIVEIYEVKINEAVLEERVKWLENAKNENIPSNIYDDYVYQLLEDFADAIEIIIYYYENTDQVVDLITYIATNYPALYARLLSYS